MVVPEEIVVQNQVDKFVRGEELSPNRGEFFLAVTVNVGFLQIYQVYIHVTFFVGFMQQADALSHHENRKNDLLLKNQKNTIKG